MLLVDFNCKLLQSIAEYYMANKEDSRATTVITISVQRTLLAEFDGMIEGQGMKRSPAIQQLMRQALGKPSVNLRLKPPVSYKTTTPHPDLFEGDGKTKP